MVKILDSLVRVLLEKLGCKLVRLNKVKEFENYKDLSDRQNQYLKLLLGMNNIEANCLQLKSQFGQDLFVLYQNNFKKNGFFVEFGATDGISISNTYVLEKDYGWKGILAEPAKNWHVDLKNNRSVIIDQRCVWSHSNEKILFNETDIKELSTIESYSSLDMHNNLRKNGNCYEVETVSLNQLLNEHKAPKLIDYLSIDTEGSEYDILKNFDFKEYNINVITVEHNFSEMREKIFELLSSKGYKRVLVEYSNVDDWYVHEGFGKF